MPELDALCYYDYIVDLMRERDSLGEFEILVLLGTLRAGEDAYGVTIRGQILERTGRDVSRGAVYVTLERLEQKGYLESRLGGATARRGGRRKRLYCVRRAGRVALRQALDGLSRMREGLDPALEES
jgi:DNA-binding PadR family transcriptional regulator